MTLRSALLPALLTLLLGAVASGTLAAPQKARFRFHFGSASVPPGYLPVTADTRYGEKNGFGFEETPSNSQPFAFSVALPEGNYRVTVVLGNADREAVTTVKAEARRLMLEKVRTARGEFVTRVFTVAVKRPPLKSGGSVRLKPAEQGHRDWDEKLTLEFSGTRPGVRALEITPASDAITVYLAGDSTVTNQRSEPWSSWGQMLPRFFTEGVAVANHAESGESLKSFTAEKRLEKIRDTIQVGDYLFIQFTHNDQKPGSSFVEPFTTFKEQLRLFADAARAKKAIPVFVTSMYRRRFDADGKIVNTLGDYPEAMRQLARDERIALIDLNALSRTFFETLGPENSKKAFVHYPAGTFPGQNDALRDDTHFNAYGGYQLARCVVESIRASVPDLARHLTQDVPPFDPRHPDPADAWSLPASRPAPDPGR